MYGLLISITKLGVIPASARTPREQVMFCPVLTASGSMMIADGGTPRATACSA
jgi:hypothetical protein